MYLITVLFLAHADLPMLTGCLVFESENERERDREREKER